MKRILKTIVVSLILIVTAFSLVACGNDENQESKVIEQYAGKWYCYKTVTNGQTVDFKNLSAYIDIELSIEFSTEKTYICHYYVNGSEGKEYPQEGSFTIEDNSLILTGDISGRAEISGTEMLVTTDGVVQYYQRNSF